eukprot:Gb_09911 [translate_table: standard]
MCHDHLLGNKTNSTCPSFRWLIENVISFEAAWIVLYHAIKLFLEKNVLISDISINEVYLGFVFWVFQYSPGHLKHWSDTRTPS